MYHRWFVSGPRRCEFPLFVVDGIDVSCGAHDCVCLTVFQDRNSSIVRVGVRVTFFLNLMLWRFCFC